MGIAGRCSPTLPMAFSVRISRLAEPWKSQLLSYGKNPGLLLYSPCGSCTIRRDCQRSRILTLTPASIRQGETYLQLLPTRL